MGQSKIYIWAAIEFTNGEKEWYCISRVLRKSILAERRVNKYWKNTMIGNYITVSTSEYKMNRARLTVGKITKISLSQHGTHSYNWTRNQFVTPEHLLHFNDAYNYLKHDYSWYNRFAIWVALKYWHNELMQTKIKKSQKEIRRKIWHTNHFRIMHNRI